MAEQEVVQTPSILAFDYTYLRLLGEGANGKTWLARTKRTGALVAIKEMKLSVMEDIKAFELFKREAETLKSLDVPGVPHFYESIFPERADETCYLVQEYVSFPSITEILNGIGQFSEADTLLIMERLAGTLLILQTQYTPPIIHRDIKPSNILCEKNGDNVQLALIDFGAVANPQKRSGGSTIAGTFGYMAPEQLQGECSIQSDYYALGATAVHMLTGVSPYTMPSDVFKLEYKPTLDAKAPKTSREVIALLDYLLAVKASDRPADANALIAAIKNVQAHRMPKAAAPVKVVQNQPQLLKLQNLLGGAFTSDTPSFITTHDSSWIRIQGIARGYKISGYGQNYLEYTFKYQGKRYVGFDANAANWAARNMKFPVRCTIGFNPQDPHINFLASLDNKQG